MLQLLLWYFGPFYLWGMNIGNYKFTAIILGCSLNYAAYFAEIYRSGIESIPTGQYEAAQLLGYTRVQTFFKIVLPQVVKIVLPSVTNEVITLVKDTSLVYSVSYIEMFAVAKQIAAAQTTVVPFKRHLLYRCSGNDHTVKFLFFHLFKAYIKLIQMASGSILCFMTRHRHKGHINLQR